MDFLILILQFLILMFIVCGVIIFFLRRTLVTSTEGAVKRLNDEIARANTKQMELTLKLKEADEELAKRQAEARQLADKMRSDAEEASKQERDKIVNKARLEGEEIIAKAQGAKEKIRADLEKEIDLKAINFAVRMLNDVLSEKAKGALDQTLTAEYIESLKNIDMSKISPTINSLEVVTLSPLNENSKSQLAQIIKEKLKRELKIENSIDPQICGGMMLKFGSMALDGSIKNVLRESAIRLSEVVEAGSH